ncbi:hypothetical protein BC834DRAFT_107759 [Gloeopeniophorella convolvens]|nr:hypothetical protein BC834DRAFT_107759 [Gloeopeniophorella convolvens]
MAHSFQIFIDDPSPQLSYFPIPDTLSIPNLTAGWNPCFGISACPSFPGQQGEGTSFHVTSLDGAAFSIQWWGNGIQLSGIATPPVTYDLQLDGHTNASIAPSTSGQILLASYQDLVPASHTLSLTVHNPTNSSLALIAIDYALINVNSTSPNVTFSTTTIDDTKLPFVGEWSFENDPSLSPLDSTFHETTRAGDNVSFDFTGAAVTVFGWRDVSSGSYTVRLDNESVTLNGKSSSKEAATLFFSTGLNDTLPHTLTITNGEDGLLAIGSINVTAASPNSVPPISGSSSSHMHGGTIAAIVVAAVLGSLVLFIACFCLWRRRRRFRGILHRGRRFVPPNGNNHSKVLDIVRGPEPEQDEFDDMYEDKGPEDKSRHTRNNGSGSLSFTLDLPIQSRPSLPPSQRDYSGNSAQELPRSPTVSLGRTGTHARESSRGVLLQDISSSEGVYPAEGRQSVPPSDVRDKSASEGTRTTSSPRDQEAQGRTEGRAFELTPILPVPPLPQVNVIASTPALGQAFREHSDNSGHSYSFLDIAASSRASSVRRTGQNASSSSSSGSMKRRNSEQSFSPTRPISLPFAMGYHRNSSIGIPDRAGPSSPSIEFPHASPNIRPLPQIPQGTVFESELEISLPPPPSRPTARPHTQSTPPLHVQTQFEEPQTLPRSVSATTAPLTSAFSGHQAPHIMLHPPALLRPHPRNTSGVSPTESVPVTVSDIHFRHSSDEDAGEAESRRASALAEHPPPHPPLPQRTYASPYIMQKLFGQAAAFELQGNPSSLQSPGAGPSRRRDRDPSPDGPSSAPGLGRPTL